jgi:hypothetical protein
MKAAGRPETNAMASESTGRGRRLPALAAKRVRRLCVHLLPELSRRNATNFGIF